MDDFDTNFEKFIQASKLSIYNEQQFASKLSSYDSDNKQLKLEYPKEANKLNIRKTKLDKIASRRISTRLFKSLGINNKELGLLLSSLRAWNGLEHRAYPSAGATYSTEEYVVCFNVENHQQKILYYDPDSHAVIDTNLKAPKWQEAKENLNIEVEGIPGLMIILVSFYNRATEKYDERGGRFALLEAGAAMQQIALKIAESKTLKGVICGGIRDEYWINKLGLGNDKCIIAIGYLVGK